MTKCLLGKCPGGGLAWYVSDCSNTYPIIQMDADVSEATPNYGVAPGVTVRRVAVFLQLCKLTDQLAEFSLNKYNGQDFYDGVSHVERKSSSTWLMLVSMVEGFTVPITITPSDSSCTTPSCGIDLDPLKNCDARLALPIGTDKFCKTAHLRNDVTIIS